MGKTVVAAIGGAVLGAIAVGAVLAVAQPAPAPGPGPGMEQPAPWRGGWMHRMHDGRDGRRPISPGAFTLIYRQPDRQLTAPDVQKIAEGFLLWNGNHTWKVTNVAAGSDGNIGFSLTTPEGSVVARFTMDPHTGRVTRAG
jgi:hypothetical protein